MPVSCASYTKQRHGRSAELLRELVRQVCRHLHRQEFSPLALALLSVRLLQLRARQPLLQLVKVPLLLQQLRGRGRPKLSSMVNVMRGEEQNEGRRKGAAICCSMFNG